MLACIIDRSHDFTFGIVFDAFDLSDFAVVHAEVDRQLPRPNLNGAVNEQIYIISSSGLSAERLRPVDHTSEFGAFIVAPIRFRVPAIEDRLFGGKICEGLFQVALAI